MKVLLFSFAFLLCTLTVLGQNSYSGGSQFEIKPKFSFQNNWKLATKLASRFLFFEGSAIQPIKRDFNIERTELELLMNKKISSLSALGAGYLIRLQEGSIKHRFIQEYSLVHELGNLGMSHRFRTDETFQQDEAISYRLRYRVGIKKAFEGQRVEPGKLYFALSNEYLQSLKDKTYDLEIRLLPSIGFKYSEKYGIAAGLDYRLEKILSDKSQQLFLLHLAWSANF